MHTATIAKPGELIVLSWDANTVDTTRLAMIKPQSATTPPATTVGANGEESRSLRVSSAFIDKSMPNEQKPTVETAVACR